MAVNYSPAIKAARMNAVRSALAGGELEIVGNGGARLACFRLTPSAGAVVGSTWNIALASDEVTAESTGVPVEARIVTSRGEIALSGLSVGKGKDVEIAYPEKADPLISAGQTVRLAAAAIAHA